MIGDLNRLLATEQFSSLGFQIINEASLMDDSPCPEPEQTNVSLSVLKRTSDFDGVGVTPRFGKKLYAKEQ
jgi:hypothetical protein